MIEVKSDREINLIKRSAEILVETRNEIKKHLKPGVSLLTLDKIAEDFILSKDAIPAFKNYENFPGTLCLSVNDQVVHGIPRDYKLKEGDIISIDMGVKYKGYYSDSCRTYAIGKCDKEVLDLLEHTKNALYEGIKTVKHGSYVSDIGKAIEKYISKYGYGIVREFTGHGIGRNLHEDPYIFNYYEKDEIDTMLLKGSVICIEPMINLGTEKVIINGFDVRTKDRKPSAHFEDMVLVLENGFEVLTCDKE